jgi:predicted XRE-type DNA-binding protein
MLLHDTPARAGRRRNDQPVYHRFNWPLCGGTANMRLRAELMTAIRHPVTEWAINQSAAARRLEVTQPRLNDLLRGGSTISVSMR